VPRSRSAHAQGSTVKSRRLRPLADSSASISFGPCRPGLRLRRHLTVRSEAILLDGRTHGSIISRSELVRTGDRFGARIRKYRYQRYGRRTGLAPAAPPDSYHDICARLGTLLSGTFCVIAVAWTAITLHKVDLTRKLAEAEILSLNAGLELRVQERTHEL